MQYDLYCARSNEGDYKGVVNTYSTTVFFIILKVANKKYDLIGSPYFICKPTCKMMLLI